MRTRPQKLGPELTQPLAPTADTLGMITDPWLCHLFILGLARLSTRAVVLALGDGVPSRYGPRASA